MKIVLFFLPCFHILKKKESKNINYFNKFSNQGFLLRTNQIGGFSVVEAYAYYLMCCNGIFFF